MIKRLIVTGILVMVFMSMAGFFFFMNYGGNNCDTPDCDCFCCHMFDSRGYEACAEFGMYVGALVGLGLGMVGSWYILRRH